MHSGTHDPSFCHSCPKHKRECDLEHSDEASHDYDPFSRDTERGEIYPRPPYDNWARTFRALLMDTGGK